MVDQASANQLYSGYFENILGELQEALSLEEPLSTGSERGALTTESSRYYEKLEEPYRSERIAEQQAKNEAYFLFKFDQKTFECAFFNGRCYLYELTENKLCGGYWDTKYRKQHAGIYEVDGQGMTDLLSSFVLLVKKHYPESFEKIDAVFYRYIQEWKSEREGETLDVTAPVL
jgi:hypothetical protein